MVQRIAEDLSAFGVGLSRTDGRDDLLDSALSIRRLRLGPQLMGARVGDFSGRGLGADLFDLRGRLVRRLRLRTKGVDSRGSSKGRCGRLFARGFRLGVDGEQAWGPGD